MSKMTALLSNSDLSFLSTFNSHHTKGFLCSLHMVAFNLRKRERERRVILTTVFYKAWLSYSKLNADLSITTRSPVIKPYDQFEI